MIDIVAERQNDLDKQSMITSNELGVPFEKRKNMDVLILENQITIMRSLYTILEQGKRPL